MDSGISQKTKPKDLQDGRRRFIAKAKENIFNYHLKFRGRNWLGNTSIKNSKHAWPFLEMNLWHITAIESNTQRKKKNIESYN